MKALLAGLTETLAGEARRFAGRIAVSIALAIAGLIAGIVGVGFLIAGAYIGLARAYSPLTASFVMAAVFLLVAVLLFGLAAGGGRKRQPTPPPRRAAAESPDAPLGMGAVSTAFAIGFARGLMRRRAAKRRAAKD